jgi:chromosomal replication initiator protein
LQPVTELTAESLWNEVSGKLRDTLNETTYHTWFGQADAGELGDGVFTIVVPNDFTREWIEEHFLGFLRSTVTEVTGREYRISFSVRDEQAARDDRAETLDPPGLPTSAVAEPSERAHGDVVGTNPKYTFDLFVIGSSNRFAHAA